MCDCNHNPSSFSGLMGLMGGLLPAGSQVKTGFMVGPGHSIFGSQGSTADIQNAVEGCLYSTGGFDLVQTGYVGSYWSDQAYLTVVVQTVYDHADIEDVGSWIQGAIESCLPDLQIIRRDATVGVGATDSAGNPLPQGNNNKTTTTPPPSQCDWSKMKWSDYLACELGITPSSAALVGAGIGIGAVVLIASLARR